MTEPIDVNAIVDSVLGGSQGATQEGVAGDNISYGPYPEEASGVPQWLAAEYRQAQQEYSNALVAAQRAGYMDAAAAQARLAAARQNLNSIRSSLDNFRAKAVADKGRHSEPVYDPRTAAPDYMTPWGEPTGGSKGNVIGLENPVTGNIYTLPKETGDSAAEVALKQAQADYYRAQAAHVGARTPGSPSIFTQGRAAYVFDPNSGAISKALDFPEELPTAWEREKEDRQYKWWQTQLDAQRESARKQAEASVFGHLSNWWQQSVPYAMLPGQQYFLGAEPGGVYSNIARMSGRSFDPNTMRPQPMQPDPLEMFRQAQTLINQGGG